MNTNQVKGKTKEIVGEVQQKAGELTGSTKHQVKGQVKQAEGKIQKTVGDVQESIKNKSKEYSDKKA